MTKRYGTNLLRRQDFKSIQIKNFRNIKAVQFYDIGNETIGRNKAALRDRKEKKLEVTCVFPNGKEAAEKLFTESLLWLYDRNKEYIEKEFNACKEINEKY